VTDSNTVNGAPGESLQTVAFAKVLAVNGVAGGIVGVGFRELVSDFAAGVGG
jgi:hypothetical protein